MIKVLDLKHVPLSKQHCFGGAWYYKVMSKPYKFIGIEGVLILPMPNIRRYFEEFKQEDVIDFSQKNLDTSSIYLGGHADFESDVGLALSRAILDGNVTTGAAVYRPFWRYITDKEDDDSGAYDLDEKRMYQATVISSHNGIKNIYAQYHPSITEHYYLPGDKLSVSLISRKKDFLQLKIRVIEKSNLLYSIKLREKYNLQNPKDFVSPLISSPGHGVNNDVTFKRVNAIDQVGNEGKTAIMTDSVVADAIWDSCMLVYKEDDIVYKTPLNDEISVTMDCPNPSAFITTPINRKNGGQHITIKPRGIT